MEHPLFAKAVLETDAFDVIVIPIHPTEVVQTVRLALWQSKLLHLLISADRAAALFQKHMAAFPIDWRAEEYYRHHLAALEHTIKMLQSSMLPPMNQVDEQVLIDIAASLAQGAKERALDRLLNLCKPGTT
jgi:hypothetical protein